MNRKIVVPDGMIEAAIQGTCRFPIAMNLHDQITPAILEAALRWWNEHPFDPTDSEVMTILQERVASGHITREDYCAIPPATVRFVLRELQRRMFLAPEPEVPEAIKDMQRIRYASLSGQEDLDKNLIGLLIEAYRRGKAAK